MMLVKFLMFLALFVTPVFAQGVPSQWQYSWNGNNAQALYPGQVTIPQLATQNCIGTSNGLLVPGTCSGGAGSTSYINVLTYATCNGTGDDSASVNTALAAAASQHKPLYIPAGSTCMVTNITPPANVSIYGDGTTSIFRRVANAGAFVGIMNVSNCGNVFTNFVLDGNKANETNTSYNLFQTGCNATYNNIANINAFGTSSGDGFRLSSTTDGANGTYTRFINPVASGNQDFAFYMTGTKNLVIENPTIDGSGITTEGSSPIANDNQNVIIHGGIVDCGGTGVGLDFSGYTSSATAPTVSADYFNVSNVTVKNCNGGYGLVLDANNSVFDDIVEINSGSVNGPILMNSINSTLSNSVIDCNQPNNGNTLCVDVGGSFNSSLNNNYIGPIDPAVTPDGGWAVSLGASVGFTATNNRIVIGNGSSGGGFQAARYDGGGGGAFASFGSKAVINDNVVTCTPGTCIFGTFFEGFQGVVLSGDEVWNSSPTTAYTIAAAGVQLLNDSVNGISNQSCQVSSAATVILPDWCSSVEVNGTTTIDKILTATQNTFQNAVAWANITAIGSGYTSNPTVTFTGGGCTTEPVGAAAITLAGTVGNLTISNPGVGCTSAPAISFSGGGGSGAAATSQFQMPDELNGEVLTLKFNAGLTITGSGSGYGQISSRNGADIAVLPGRVYQLYNGPVGTGLWTQPQ